MQREAADQQHAGACFQRFDMRGKTIGDIRNACASTTLITLTTAIMDLS